ncbi:hypothetical protein F5X99DRAFT_357830 [Biscogniauxia marginata]|nr:hypothetical protein F5X99DRAFT_357830 [Biscogniauxia marginata]
MRLLPACRWGRLRSLSTRSSIIGTLLPRLQPPRISAPPTTPRYFSDSNPPYPDARTTEHHDLASYAAYAARTGLDVDSKLFVGTHFEYTVAAALAPLGFSIKRVGGRSDGGIDLLGTWAVPSALTPVRVILQCKVSSRGTNIRPNIVRELEGTFVGAPVGWRGAGVLGMLVAQKPATKGMREAIGRSRWPMGFICCSKDGNLEQMIWNHKAEEKGLEGVGVAIQFPQGARSRGRPRLVLTWKGKPYVPERPSSAEEDNFAAKSVKQSANMK